MFNVERNNMITTEEIRNNSKRMDIRIARLLDNGWKHIILKDEKMDIQLGVMRAPQWSLGTKVLNMSELMWKPLEMFEYDIQKIFLQE